MTPAQPSNPQTTPNEGRVPRKRQARLDDNGEPAGVPVAKKTEVSEPKQTKKDITCENETRHPKKKT